MGCAKACAHCLSLGFLGLSGVVYFLLGLSLTAAATATFFTPAGEIITPAFGGITLGGGLLILLVGVIGLLATCKRGVCWLWLFTMWTFLLLVLAVVGAVFMFQYEDLLHEASRVNAEGGVIGATDAVSATATKAVRELTHNAVKACNATTTATGVPFEYDFLCGDGDFTALGDVINDICYHDKAGATLEPVAINATVGSAFAQCYQGDYMKDWQGSIELSAPHATSALLLDILNTPKGLFCACSSTIIDEYVLPMIRYTKFVALGVVAFFAIALVCCVGQICSRGCCGGREAERLNEKPKDLESIQMTYPDPRVNPAKSKKYSAQLGGGGGGYVARP